MGVSELPDYCENEHLDVWRLVTGPRRRGGGHGGGKWKEGHSSLDIFLPIFLMAMRDTPPT